MKKTLLATILVLVILLSSCRSQRIDEDREAPVITINTYDKEFFLGATIPIISASCEDDFDEICTVKAPNYPDLSKHGVHIVTFTATDTAGNTATETVTVTAIDRSRYIDSYETIVELGSVYIFPIASCISTESDTCTVSKPPVLATDQVTSELCYDIIGEDNLENRKTVTICVAVVDTTAPSITLNGLAVIDLELHDEWTDPGVNTSDLQEGVVVTVDKEVDVTIAGAYVLTYTAEDLSGNIATTSRTVNVIDPSTYITLVIETHETVVELGNAYLFPIVSCTSTKSGVCNVTIPTTLATELVNPEICYTVTGQDDLLHATSVEICVAVVDTTPPTITLVGDAVVALTVGAVWTDPGVTTNDLQAGVTVTTNITVDTATVGIYTIIYTAEDASGNTATVQRTVNVN